MLMLTLLLIILPLGSITHQGELITRAIDYIDLKYISQQVIPLLSSVSSGNKDAPLGSHKSN